MNYLDYLDFDLEIRAGSNADYLLAARSDAGEAQAALRLPFDPMPSRNNLELQNRLQSLRIALLSAGGKQRRTLTKEERDVQRFGSELFEALMVGDVRSQFALLQARAEQQERGVRIRLRIQPPELAMLPWEFLYDPRSGEYVCLSFKTPIVRYLEVSQPIQLLPVVAPLRILALVASPRDLEPLDVALEKQRIERSLAGLLKEGRVELTWLAGQSWRDLQRAMRRGPWHIFHFIGHGDYDTPRDEGFVVLCDDQGDSYRLYANELSRLLADHRPLRLVLLNACKGASNSQDLYRPTTGTVGGAESKVQCLATTYASSHFCTKQHRAIQNPKSKIDFDWIHIPAGEFLMGSKDGESDEKPEHKVMVSAYWIAKTPVTNAQYQQFVSASGHRSPYYWKDGKIPNGKAQHPVVHVTWEDAVAFCQWAGVNLPTEAQWEKAARGTDGRIYPWGNQTPTPKLLNYKESQIDDTCEVGLYPDGASPYGLLDMAGNVWEWTADWYDGGYYNKSPTQNPTGPEKGSFHTVRGGSYYRDARGVRSSVRGHGDDVDDWLDNVGFRVVAAVSPL